MSRMARWLIALLLSLNVSAVQAHNRGTSYSYWHFSPPDATGMHAEVRVRLSQLELTRLQLDPYQTPDYRQQVAALLTRSIQLWSGDQRCESGAADLQVGADGWLSAKWQLVCPHANALTLRSQLLLDIAPSHLHLARLQMADGQIREQVLTYAEPAFTLRDAPPPVATSFGAFIRLGIEHILSGWDHLAFLLGLILLAPRLRDIAVIATGFTLAHSLTLAAAVLGWIQTQSTAVEALIGFSIALVAMENLWLRSGREPWLPRFWVMALLVLALTGASTLPRPVLLGTALYSACYFGLLKTSDHPGRLRLALTFIFGLVHGLGFAGIMQELNLPQERLALSLIGFNLGVELGQLAVIALAWPLLRVMQRSPLRESWTTALASTALCGLGSYWFVVRSFG